jgi:hypothetical protein
MRRAHEEQGRGRAASVETIGRQQMLRFATPTGPPRGLVMRYQMRWLFDVVTWHVACSQKGGESPRYANPRRGMSWLDAVLLLVCVAGVSVVRRRDGE